MIFEFLYPGFTFKNHRSFISVYIVHTFTISLEPVILGEVISSRLQAS